MRIPCALLTTLVLAPLALAQATAPRPAFAWLAKSDPKDAVAARIGPPAGYQRTKADAGSFGAYLRSLPLKPAGSPVLLFDGTRKARQDVHAAVLDIDVGTRDLQQCADAVMRLRAEYLLAAGKPAEILFHFTSGHAAAWSKWSAGERPTIRGSTVTWSRTAAADGSYQNFRRYLETVFTYAGTRSLARELAPVEGHPIAAGDVFIQPGSPGHAVIVMDTATNPATGKAVFLLAQSYMPAQEIHILKNPSDAALSPWYPADFGDTLVTPEWTFKKGDLKQF